MGGFVVVKYTHNCLATSVVCFTGGFNDSHLASVIEGQFASKGGLMVVKLQSLNLTIGLECRIMASVIGNHDQSASNSHLASVTKVKCISMGGFIVVKLMVI